MDKFLIAVWVLAVCSMCALADVDRIAELNVSEDVTVSVEAGAVKRIEYVSGTAVANIIKEGEGTLEVAIVGNTNAIFRVNGGKLKFVRPGKLALESDVWFHLDPTDTTSFDSTVENGTNLVDCIRSATFSQNCPKAKVASGRPYPFLVNCGLNGLPVLDFGTMHNAKRSGYGAALELSEKVLINEILYVSCDEPGIENVELRKDENGADVKILGPNPINWRYSYRGYGGGGSGYPMYHTAHSQVAANLYVDDAKVATSFVPDPGWHIVRAHSNPGSLMTSKVADYGFYGFGASPVYYVSYGGFKLAEVVASTNLLSAADRTKTIAYLKRKWFGGYPIKSILLARGTQLDLSEAPVAVGFLQAMDSAEIVEESNLRLVDTSGASSNLVVSAIYNAGSASRIPNLGFSGDGEVVASEDALLNLPRARGLLQRAGTAD